MRYIARKYCYLNTNISVVLVQNLMFNSMLLAVTLEKNSNIYLQFLNENLLKSTLYTNFFSVYLISVFNIYILKMNSLGIRPGCVK